MDVMVYNQEGEQVGSVELKPEVFGVEPNEAVVHQYVVNYLARQREGNASTKTRREVRGGGRKPWRQKGTGRARAGTIRSPIWRGGGTTFGPQQRSYGSKMPRQMKRLAMKSVLSEKAKAERIKVLDRIELSEIKTKAVYGVMSKLDLENKKCLVLDEGNNGNLLLSCRNLPEVKYCRATLAFTKAGLEKIEEVFG